MITDERLTEILQTVIAAHRRPDQEDQILPEIVKAIRADPGIGRFPRLPDIGIRRVKRNHWRARAGGLAGQARANGEHDGSVGP